MHPDLQNRLAGLPREGEVFVCRQVDLGSDDWKVYQERELKYWQDNYDSGGYPDYKESFYRTLSRFEVEPSFFSGKRVLEIGCGPQGFSAGLVQLVQKQPEILVIVDSLLDKYQDFPTFSLFGNKAVKIAAPGEEIPVPSDFFDIVFCQNVLDHVNKPAKVVGETLRVLRQGGTALVSVHTLSVFFKVFEPLIRKLDTNHPHHFTDKDISGLFEAFDVFSFYSVPLFQDNPNLVKDRVRRLKTYAGTRFLRTTYLKARKM